MTVTRYLICLVFCNRSMFMDIQSDKAPFFGKDTVYLFKNATHTNRMRLTTLLLAKSIEATVESLTNANCSYDAMYAQCAIVFSVFAGRCS